MDSSKMLLAFAFSTFSSLVLGDHRGKLPLNTDNSMVFAWVFPSVGVSGETAISLPRFSPLKSLGSMGSHRSLGTRGSAGSRRGDLSPERDSEAASVLREVARLIDSSRISLSEWGGHHAG